MTLKDSGMVYYYLTYIFIIKLMSCQNETYAELSSFGFRVVLAHPHSMGIWDGNQML